MEINFGGKEGERREKEGKREGMGEIGDEVGHICSTPWEYGGVSSDVDFLGAPFSRLSLLFLCDKGTRQDGEVFLGYIKLYKVQIEKKAKRKQFFMWQNFLNKGTSLVDYWNLLPNNKQQLVISKIQN